MGRTPVVREQGWSALPFAGCSAGAVGVAGALCGAKAVGGRGHTKIRHGAVVEPDEAG